MEKPQQVFVPLTFESSTEEVKAWLEAKSFSKEEDLPYCHVQCSSFPGEGAGEATGTISPGTSHLDLLTEPVLQIRFQPCSIQAL